MEINIVICDRCGEIIHEYEYNYVTMPPYRLCACKCGNIMNVVDELYEKYKKEVDEIVNNLNIINNIH